MQIADVRVGAPAQARLQRRSSRANAVSTQAACRKQETAHRGLSSSSAHGQALTLSSSKAQRRSVARFAVSVEAKATGPLKVNWAALT